MRIRTFIQFVIGSALLAGGLSAVAQEKAARGERRSFMGLINIDSLVDNYSNFLARKYNLNPEQDDFTHQLLRDKAHQFWDKNEGQLSGLMDRMFDVRTGGDMAPDELVDWGKSVLPLYNDAKSIIVDGNSEWREILTEEQKRLHDEDLKLMQQSFSTTDEQIERIVSGTMTVEEFRSPSRNPRNPKPTPPQPPLAQTVVNEEAAPPPGEMSPERAEKQREHEAQAQAEQEGQAPEEPGERAVDEETIENEQMDEGMRLRAEKAERARREAAGEPEPGEEQPPDQPQVEHQPPVVQHGEAPQPPQHEQRQPSTKGPAAGKGFEGEWEQYTKQFIARFKLNDEQTQRANAILADCKEQGVRHMNSKKAEIERLDARVAEVQKNKDASKAGELTALTQQRQKLMEPLTRIFEQQLKPRLDKLPTRVQREAAETAKTPPPGTANKPGAHAPKPAPTPPSSGGRSRGTGKP